jgi:hypothetical protein
MKHFVSNRFRRFGVTAIAAASLTALFVTIYWLVKHRRSSSDLDDFLHYYFDQALGVVATFSCLVGLLCTSGLVEGIIIWLQTGEWSKENKSSAPVYVVVLQGLMFVLICWVFYTYAGDNHKNSSSSKLF